MEAQLMAGERLAVLERVIVAPASGRFRSDANGAGPSGDRPVVAEQVIGLVEGVGGHSTPVESPFAGHLQGLLVHEGERVREGQPVAWLRLA